VVPGGFPHSRASPQGQDRRVAPRHGQGNGARVDGPGAAAGWRPTRHSWGAGVAHKRLFTDRVPLPGDLRHPPITGLAPRLVGADAGIIEVDRSEFAR
jgi:hypothetical protein